MLFRNILLCLISLVVSLLLVEVVLRFADPFGISYFPKTAAYLDTMEMHEILGYRNRPNLRGEAYGQPVEINSIGFRDREIPPNKDQNEYRIYILGDSLPFGIGVKREESFVYLLEKRFNERAENGRRVRTINGGTISYNTEQELLQLKTVGLGLAPDMVVLVFSENDIYPRMWIFEKRRKWYVKALEPSYTASLALVAVRMSKMILSRLRRKPDLQADLDPVPAMGYRVDSEDWKRIEDSLTEISRICRQLSIPFVVFAAVPERSAASKLLKAVADREKFAIFSMALGEDDPRRKDPEKYRNSFVDGHPNPAGNQLDAAKLYESLLSLGIQNRISSKGAVNRE